MNERVRRVRDIIEESFDAIDAKVRELVREVSGKELEEISPDPTEAKIQDWRDTVNEEAVQSAGFGYSTYIRMKISGIVDRYARTVCDITNFPEDTDQAFFVRSVLRSWARDRLLFEKGMPPSKAQLEFIQNFDLEYSQRRLRFVIDGLNWYYRDLDKGEPGRSSRARSSTRSRLAWTRPSMCSSRRWREAGARRRSTTACWRASPRVPVREYTAPRGLHAAASTPPSTRRSSTSSAAPSRRTSSGSSRTST